MTKGPMILTVGWDADSDADAAYRSERGWIPGVDHSVILLGRVDDHHYEIADPAPGIGREYWTEEELRSLWRGYGVRLRRGT